MTKSMDPFRFLLIALSGWMNQQQLQLIDYLRHRNGLATSAGIHHRGRSGIAPANEYLAAENRILRAKIKDRLQLSDGEKSTLAEIARRRGTKGCGRSRRCR